MHNRRVKHSELRRMITHKDWDEGTKQTEPGVLPDSIDSITVSHDGGRLTITVNDVQIFYSCEGTRDCTIHIDRSGMPAT